MRLVATHGDQSLDFPLRQGSMLIGRHPSCHVCIPARGISRRHCQLYVDGAKRQTSPVLEVPPGGELTHEITFTFQRSGLRRGEVLLTGDVIGQPSGGGRIGCRQVDAEDHLVAA